ncbi:hypothetical protein U9M48_041259 [Paspalum notatum var. saurae]|uniref:U3 small nucleolar RNA-associated protein 18 homolog n=1 Tax=Paspalum notatum var. saurae TaxID=547442 RepID=A0AAQ3UND9_PASNO
MDRKTHLPGASDSESDDEGGGDDILRNNNELVVKDHVKLLPGMLEFSRLVDANDPSSGPINSLQFHRNGQLMLAPGLDKHLRFFQIDGKRNPKIQSIFVGACPVLKASFLPDGSEVILSGRRKFFFYYKIGPLTGREDKILESFEISPDSRVHILLISAKTKQLIGTLKMNGSVRSLASADGGNQLLSSGGDGHVYHWDLGTRKCIHKATDDGSLAGVLLCTSKDSSLGIVNVYKRDDFLGGKRKPLKTIENLTTDVEEMKFNHDAQILAITSRKERNGMRLVHVPSFTVFQNWPGPRFSLHYPRCLDFSPGSGFLSVGHAGGKENHFSLLQRETEKLPGDIDKMRSELKYEIDKVTAGQLLDLNLERGEYIKKGIEADDMEALYKVHAAICADPTFAKYNAKKLTYEQRKATLVTRLNTSDGADEDEGEEDDE